MKIGEELFDNKIAVINTINNIYARHGNGCDIIMNISQLIVSAHIFNTSNPATNSMFRVEMQEGNQDVMRDITELRMIKSLRKCGAEFVTMGEVT